MPFGSQVCGRLLEARAAFAAAAILLHVAHDHVVADLRFPLAMNPTRLSSRRATGALRDTRTIPPIWTPAGSSAITGRAAQIRSLCA